MDLLSILVMLVVLYVLAVIGSEIFERFGVPGLIGEILVGIILVNIIWDGSAFSGILSSGNFLGMLGVEVSFNGFDGSFNYQFLFLVAEIGAMFLLFSVGLETRVCELMSVGKAALTVAILGVVFPFAAGMTVYFYDYNTAHAMYMAAAMVATSVGVTAKVIMDMRASNTKEARIIVGAAVIDDVLGMIVLAIVAGMASADGTSILGIARIVFISVSFVLAVFFFCNSCTPRIASWYGNKKECKLPTEKETRKLDKMMIAIAVCLFMAALSQALGLAAIIGAFLAGMILADYAKKWNLKPKVEAITTFFLPLFFLNVGLQVKLSSLTNVNVLMLAAYVIALAVITKYLGCYFGARMADKNIDKKSAKIIGIGMVPRAEVGIIIAAIGLSSGHLTPDMNATIVLMSVITTVIAPPLLYRAYRKKYPDGIPDSPAISCWQEP
ncbi:MAG: cation:proton antiporter [Candidatus Methanomethylophilaceae archaeon]|jgi:Kef-type K+ transport system membrane component KefB|nr:cation:proton antiporter [Candidatus Methanomethylophilaceae archaeon]MDD3351529.1 cation:proton antiporter [Candidatus Methanomethylophilaceae archaeon]MDD3986461.1 cation:proton antiporter [Candidatus Methanomethylophilaceae archaeon]